MIDLSMKKILLVCLVLVAFIFILVSFFIPQNIVASKSVVIRASPQAVYRSLLKEKNWQQWWPAETKRDSTAFLYGGAAYHLKEKLFNAFLIDIRKKDELYSSELILLPVASDSVQIQWGTVLPELTNPFAKLKGHFKAGSLKDDLQKILSGCKAFYEKNENVYGSAIKEARVKDTALLATKLELDHYPATKQVYALIDKLRDYIKREGALETDYPMLHVDSVEQRYVIMIGIPTNRLLDGDNKDFFSKRMVLGNLLVTEVKGGHATTRYALQQLEQYIDDYKRISPAIPYESLVTDRLKETDTLKWITRIYYPVF